MKSIRRILCCLLVLALLGCMVPVLAQAAENTTEFQGGSGTAYDPYLVATKEHLNNVRKYPDAHFRQVADITFAASDFTSGGAYYNSGKGWAPIGTSSQAPFYGYYNGNGYYIYNLTIGGTSSDGNAVGLFGTSNGWLCNIALRDVKIDLQVTKYTRVGAVVGSQNYNPLLGCSTTGTVNVTTSAGVVVGGIAGVADAKHCRNNASVSLEHSASITSPDMISGSDVGGVVGWGNNLSYSVNSGTIYTDCPSTEIGGVAGLAFYITDCTNSGAVTLDTFAAQSDLPCNVGGVVGYLGTQALRCNNLSKVIGSAYEVYVGGITGFFEAGDTEALIDRCRDSGAVTTIPTSGKSNTTVGNVGGIVGYVQMNCTISNCYATNTVTLATRGTTAAVAGGIAGYFARDAVMEHCYSLVSSVTVNSGAPSWGRGGLIGHNYGTVRNSLHCYSWGVGYNGGTNGSLYCANTSMLQTQTNYTNYGFDFSSVWKMGSGTYPYAVLRCESGHAHSLTHTAQKLGCTTSGNLEYWYCSGCDTYFAGDDVLPVAKDMTVTQAIGHQFTNYVSNNDATTTADGTKTALCDNGCGATDTVTDEGSKLEPEDAIAEGTYGSNITWKLKMDGTLVISGSGEIPEIDFFDYESAWLSVRDQVKAIVIEDGITRIGNFAFYPMPYATSISLPDSLTSIGDGAFRECKALKEIVLPKNLTVIEAAAFEFCQSIEEITIPDGVTEIPNIAFWDCDNLKTIHLGSGVKVIAKEAFKECAALTSITIPANVESIDPSAFVDCTSLNAFIVNPENQHYASDESNVLFNKSMTELLMTPVGLSGHYTIPDTVEIISKDAFRSRTALTGVTLSKNLKTIGSSAFSNCSGLTEIAFPEGLETIGSFAFDRTGLQGTITFPNSLKRIETYAFYDCSGIQHVIFGKGIQNIARMIFNGCGALDVEFLGNAPSFEENAFYGTYTTAHVPAGNDTWTDEVKRDYGASRLTWTTYDSGWSGDLSWKLKGGVLTFSGNGLMKNYTTKDGMPWYKYLDEITSVVIEDGVTRIGNYAFYGAPNLESVTIAESVTTIGEFAFKGCEKLLTMELPSKLTKLGESAFYGCISLQRVDIPESLWTVQPYTFKNCTGLRWINFAEGNLQKISDGAFYNTAVMRVDLPDCLQILDVYAFKNCSALTSINLGSGLTEIREAAFYGAPVVSMWIPNGITKIGPYAFKNCTSMTSVDIPASMTSIGEASFYACTALKAVKLPDAVTNIGDYAFRKCAAIKTLTLGDELTEIGECAFYGCSGITELVIPDKVTTIKPYAFKTCTGLTSVTLGSSLETIDESAFNTCTGLKTLVIPASVKTIGDYCFSGSWNLWQLTFEGSAPTIGTGAFKGMAATISYPKTDATWTADIMQNYGGKILWKAA